MVHVGVCDIYGNDEYEKNKMHIWGVKVYMGSPWVVGVRAGMISKYVLVCCLGKGKHQKMLQQRDWFNDIDPGAM